MILRKNKNLLSILCQVYLKSVRGQAFPHLSETHTSLSKSNWRSDSYQKDGGVLYKNRLDLMYRGLSKTIFEELDILLQGHYQVMVKNNYGDYYQLSSKRNPMLVTSKFTNKESKLTFTNESFIPFEYTDIKDADVEGFAYTLTLNLS